PELDQFLQDEIDVGTVLASKLGLTPARYCQALGRWHDSTDRTNQLPAGWLGGMLFKVLRDETPTTNRGLGRPYTAEEIDFFWDAAQKTPLNPKPNPQAKRKKRQPDKRLWEAVRNWAGRRPVFTVTGRLRAHATFCSSRNTIFQGTAADGAILGLWRVWRA